MTCLTIQTGASTTIREVNKMVNMQHVYEFCNYMRANYGAGFTQHPTMRGVKITGQYYTCTGQVISIILTVYQNKIEVRLYDASKRMIYNDNIKENITMNIRLNRFIQNTVMS